MTALADQPRHGYGIIQEVAGLSDARISLLPGTLYTALDRLTAAGHIEFDRDEVIDGRVRRYYRLAPSGRQALEAQAAHLRQLATAAETRLRRLRPNPAS